MFQPLFRPRRLRLSENLRRMIRETTLSPDDFICPLFVTHGREVKREITSMPGQYQQSIDNIVRDCEEIQHLGIPAVILFGIPEHKDELGSEAYSDEGIVQHAIKAIKHKIPELTVITDVCLCEYTSHGHCGIVKHGKIQNDATLELLAREAVSHVKAGADMVAPSDMMDGRVEAIRCALDASGYHDVPIMAYAVKYASSFYGPFREAADCAPQFGDRRTYQMDPPNSREAIREAALDIDEGADIVMVKPALAYLDIIYQIKQQFNLPVAAYNVSGEYSMIKAAAKLGWMDGERAMMESLIAIKRAGADIILSYFAREAAAYLREKS